MTPSESSNWWIAVLGIWIGLMQISTIDTPDPRRMCLSHVFTCGHSWPAGRRGDAAWGRSARCAISSTAHAPSPEPSG